MSLMNAREPRVSPDGTLAVTSSRPDMFHIVCAGGCDDDTALCGTDVRDLPWTDGTGELECVVCADLEGFPCRLCGFHYSSL